MTTKYYQYGENLFYRSKKRGKNEYSYLLNTEMVFHCVNLHSMTYEYVHRDSVEGEKITRDIWQKALNNIIKHLQKQL